MSLNLAARLQVAFELSRVTLWLLPSQEITFQQQSLPEPNHFQLCWVLSQLRNVSLAFSCIVISLDNVLCIIWKETIHSTDFFSHFHFLLALAAQAYAIKEENDSLRWQLDAYRNEVELLKQEKGQLFRTEESLTKDQQLQFLQQTMQGMQQVLLRKKRKGLLF